MESFSKTLEGRPQQDVTALRVRSGIIHRFVERQHQQQPDYRNSRFGTEQRQRAPAHRCRRRTDGRHFFPQSGYRIHLRAERCSFFFHLRYTGSFRVIWLRPSAKSVERVSVSTATTSHGSMRSCPIIGRPDATSRSHRYQETCPEAMR